MGRDLAANITHILAVIDAQARFIARGALHREQLMSDTSRVLSHLKETGNLPSAQAMYRYLLEGASDSYHDDPELLELLTKLGCWNSDIRLIDLGAGPGNLVRRIREQGGDAVGVDLSPSFVSHNDALRVGLIDTPDQSLSGVPAGAAPFDTVVSCLTLDRVSHPRQLLANMAELAGQRGTIVLITLLPLVPEDDENVSQRIVYTLPEHRLSTPGTVEGDIEVIGRLLKQVSGRSVSVERTPYSVRTATGPCTYENVYAFVARSSTVTSPCEMVLRKSS